MFLGGPVKRIAQVGLTELGDLPSREPPRWWVRPSAGARTCTAAG